MAHRRRQLLHMTLAIIAFVLTLTTSSFVRASQRPKVHVRVANLGTEDNNGIRARVSSEKRSNRSLSGDMTVDHYLAEELAKQLQSLIPVYEFISVNAKDPVTYPTEIQFEFHTGPRNLRRWPVGELWLTVTLFEQGSPQGLPVELLALKPQADEAIQTILIQITRAYDSYGLTDLFANIELIGQGFATLDEGRRRIHTSETYESLSITPTWPSLRLVLGAFVAGNVSFAACSVRGARPDAILEGFSVEWPVRVTDDCRSMRPISDESYEKSQGTKTGIYFKHYYRVRRVEP